MSRTSASKAMATIAGIGALALIVSSCSSSSTPSTAATGSSTPPAAASTSVPSSAAPSSTQVASSVAPSSSGGASSSGSTAAAAVPGDDDTYCDFIKKTYGDLSGKTVSVYAGITGEEGTNLAKAWKDFQTCTGATVSYNPDKDFEKNVVVQAQGGNAPDIGLVPQPGLLATLVATGKVIPADSNTEANVDKYWDKGWKTFGSVDGKFEAAPLGANVKSLVWYSPKTFTAKGYTVPTTWDEMIALSDKIAATGAKPWCAGIESGTATGWHATDWLEEIVMRQAGPTVYQDWITHKVKFSDEPIAKALATAGSIWKNAKYVNGGIGDVGSIATTTWSDGGLPVQTGDCTLFQAANFMQSNWKNNPKIAEDGDLYAFYLPSIDTKFGKPVEVGGEFTTAFRDAPEVKAFQYYLSTSHFANQQSINGSSRISANKGLEIKNVQGPINLLSVQILQDPKAVSLFDASDLMPAAVGSGAEWSELTQWITGQDDKTTLANIDAAWPSS